MVTVTNDDYRPQMGLFNSGPEEPRLSLAHRRRCNAPFTGTAADGKLFNDLERRS
jgi:hypothetical protein